MMLLLLLVATPGSDASLPLPAYVKPCARTAPDFSECCLQHAKEVFPHIVQGDRKYGIPSADPAEVTEVRVENGPKQAGINLHIRDIKLFGLKDAQLQEVNFQIEKSDNRFKFRIPELQCLGQYEMTGRVLLLPITGKGLLNFTLTDADLELSLDSKLEDREGERFVVFSNPRLELEPSRVYYHLTNLFNGDKFLGEEMNALLNREWRDTHRELAPPLLEVANQIIINLINNFAQRVSYDTWFPEKL